MNFGEKVKLLRTKNRLSQGALGRMTGSNQSAVSRVEASEIYDPEKTAISIEKLATALGTSVEYLKDESNSVLNITDIAGNFINLSEYVFIPRYDVVASAGHGADISEETRLPSIPLLKSYIREELKIQDMSGLIIIDTTGDSMIGDIDDGASILVDTHNTTLNNGIYAIMLNNDLIVKRADRRPGGKIRIMSNNPVYEDFDIDASNIPEDFIVRGRVMLADNKKIL